VRLDVAKVLLGNFSGGSFDFAVHSPARSGLQVGRTYTVTATRRGDGYAVDERQWRRSTKRYRRGNVLSKRRSDAALRATGNNSVDGLSEPEHPPQKPCLAFG
jgi:hypothetical protein